MKSITCIRLKGFALALLVVGPALLATACAGGGSPTAPSAGGGTSTGPASGPASGTEPSSPAVGTYRLTTVNGHPVPGVFDSYSPAPGITMRMEANSGQIIMNDDGTYTQDTETQLSGNNMPAPVVRKGGGVGLYTLEGGVLTLTPYLGSPYHPTYTPGQIQIVTEAPGLNGQTDSVVWVYRKK